jgi:succinyl-CoA synthetase beta subunit
MRLHEYQAKEILAKTSVPVPRGVVVSTPDEAESAFESIGAPICVVKAQVLTGGRGKAGGIKAVHSAEEARDAAAELLGRRLVTAQTGPEGAVIRKLLVEEGLGIEKEYYLGITIDREAGRPVLIASSAGGVEIERVAKESPESIVREPIEPVLGLQPYQARKVAFALGVERNRVGLFVDTMLKLHVAFLVNDLELAEINPLVQVEEDDFVALDCKMVVDDSALFRHEDLKRLADPGDMDPLEYEAKKSGVNYIKLKGNIGCMVNGAGLAMATMDLIKGVGGEPANFLDVGGGADEARIRSALKVLLMDEQVEAVLINIFGGILRCDVLAHGITAAARDLTVTVPMVVRLEGTNRDEGARILMESGLDIRFAHGMREAGELAVSMIKSDA